MNPGQGKEGMFKGHQGREEYLKTACGVDSKDRINHGNSDFKIVGDRLGDRLVHRNK